MSTANRRRLKSWLKSRMFRQFHGMISCRELEDFVQAYVDGDLPDQQRTVFERHIRWCRECREYLAAYRRTMEVAVSVQAAPGDPVPEDIPEDLIKAILKARTQ